MNKIARFSLFIITCLLIIIVSSLTALGNSAQMVFNADTGFEMLPITDEDITVESEELIFDFSKYEITPHGGLYCDIIATYNFHNQGDTKTIQMGFPFITSFTDMNLEEINISNNGEEIDYQVYFGKIISYSTYNTNPEYISKSQIENLTFSEAVDGAITQSSYIDPSLECDLYTLDNTQISQDFTKISFKINYSLSSVLVEGEDSYSHEYTDAFGYQLVTITKNNRFRNSKLFFIVIGDDIIDLKVNGYNLDEKGKQINYLQYNENQVLSKETINLKDFITLYAEENISNYEIIEYFNEKTMEFEEIEIELDRENAVKILEYEIANAIERKSFYTLKSIINKAWKYERIAIIVYEAEIKNNLDNFVSIKYKYTTGADFRYQPAIFPVNYISNPSKNWASFGNLTVKVLPPRDYYVIKSSLAFEKQSDGSYEVVLEKLPERNIVFDICADEDPIRTRNTWNNFLYALAFILRFFWWLILLIIAIPITIIVIKKLRKHKLKNR